MKAQFDKWLTNRSNAAVTREIYNELVPMMKECGCNICKQLLELQNFIPARSQWIFGGDGWVHGYRLRRT